MGLEPEIDVEWDGWQNGHFAKNVILMSLPITNITPPVVSFSGLLRMIIINILHVAYISILPSYKVPLHPNYREYFAHKICEYSDRITIPVYTISFNIYLNI